MAFPFTVNPAAPLDTDSASFGDDELRALKQALIDLFGLPSSPTNITNAIMGVAADGTITTPGLVRLGTITAQKALLDGTAAWNQGGTTFTAILANITDTASAAASKLIDLQVGGVSKFSVDKAGRVSGLNNLTQPGGGEALKIIRGRVNSSGFRVSGAGFIVSRTATGEYTINFLTGFSDVPAVDACQSTTIGHIAATLTDTISTVIVTKDTAGTPQNRDFSFIATGPI